MSYNVFTLPPGDCGALDPKRKCLNIANGRIADILSRNMNWPNKHGLTRFDRIGCESSKELRHEAPVDQLHYWKDVTERSAYIKNSRSARSPEPPHEGEVMKSH